MPYSPFVEIFTLQLGNRERWELAALGGRQIRLAQGTDLEVRPEAAWVVLG